MEPLAPGDPARIGPFRLVARLGRGGMGRVYLGRSETTGRAVAVKTVHGELLADAEFRTRFSHEVAAALKVRDEYIAEVVDADPDGATPWLATAYVPGISVEDAVRRFGPLPADSVRILGVCVAKAVAAIHAVGLVHRDLKPGNVLLTAAGPKVIDFGIARGVSEAALTKTGMVSGSPPYMAPEQLGYGAFGTASDVFSLGAVLHYAATATGPYGRGGAQEQYARAMGIGPVIDPALPDSLTDLLSQCFAGDPNGRPTTAEVVHALEAHPGERPLPGWLPTAVVSDILAQATDALNKDSAAGLAHSHASASPSHAAPPPPRTPDGPSYPPPRPQPQSQAASGPQAPSRPQPQPQSASMPQSPPPFTPLVPPRPTGPPYSSGPSYSGGQPHSSAPSHSSGPSYSSGPPQPNAPLRTPPQQNSYQSQPQSHSPRQFTAPPNHAQPYNPPSYPSQPSAAVRYGYPYQAPPPSNGLAVTALVLSLVGIVAPCLLVVALPIGGVALAKARKLGGVGHGQALAGTIVASVLLLGWILFISVLVATSP